LVVWTHGLRFLVVWTRVGFMDMYFGDMGLMFWILWINAFCFMDTHSGFFETYLRPFTYEMPFKHSSDENCTLTSCNDNPSKLCR
jgi:hypothetical protein